MKMLLTVIGSVIVGKFLGDALVLCTLATFGMLRP